MIEESESGVSLKTHYWSYLVQLGIITVIYFVIAKLSLALTGHPSPVWPPAGFALAVILLFGYRLWPGIAMGTFLEVILEGLPVMIAFAAAAGSAGGALAGAYLLKRMGFRNSLERLRDVLGLVVLACMVSTTISATFGALSFYLFGIIPWAASGSFWMTWWLGDVLGVIVVTPLVLVWGKKRPLFDLKSMQIAEALALMISLVLVSNVVFSGPDDILNSPYITFPFLIWAALRFGQKGTTAAIMIVSGIAIWHTAHGEGPFIKGTPAGNLEFLQVFTGVVTLTILILAAVITEHKKAEENIRSKSLYARNLIETSLDPLVTISPEGKITDVNQATEHVTGLARDKLIGTDFSNNFTEPGKARESYQEVFLKEFIRDYPLAIRHRSGKINDVLYNATVYRDEFGKVQGVFAVARDITERKKAEEALKESEERYRRLVEFSPYGIAIHSEGKMVYMNLAGAKILGTENPDEFYGKMMLQIIHPDYHEIVKNRVRMQEEGKVAPPLEEKFLRLDGTSVDVEIVSIPFTYMGKQAMYGIFRDITERKTAEENIIKSLKEKELLLREIHHRVKNNMQIISSMLNLQMGYINDKKITDIFSESQNRILSMALVHEKLYQSSDLRNIDFKEYIHDLGANLLQSYNANYIELNVNVEDISLDIDLAIPAGLIINELITNSLKYAFPDGMKGEINISLRSIGENMLELVVGDNGIGLAKDLNIRETKTLGLHLVTLLAESQLHGKIDINRDKGTEFQIKFKGIK